MKLLDEHLIDMDVDLSRYKFRGKLAGKSWELEQSNDWLRKIRKVLWMTSVLLFYPVVMEYLSYKVFDWAWFIERLIFSGILVLCAAFFNRFRLASLIVALIPMGLIFMTYVFIIEYFPIRRIAFIGAILVLIGIGIYFHFKEIRLRQELSIEVRKENPEAEILNIED